MKDSEIDAVNETIRQIRGMMEDVRTAAITTRNGYAEALANVASDCLARLVIEKPKRKK